MSEPRSAAERRRCTPDAIRVENIRKSFGVVTALEDVSLHLRAGRGASG